MEQGGSSQASILRRLIAEISYGKFLLRLGAVALASLLVAFACTVLFLALNLGFAASSPQTRLAEISTAVRSGLLDEKVHPYLLEPHKAMPIWNHNECMILFMVMDDNPDLLAKTLSPRIPVGAASDCVVLKNRLSGKTVPLDYYHRYLHGFRVLTAGMMVLMPLAFIPWVLLSLTVGLIVAGPVVAGRALLKGTGGRTRQAGNLVIGMALALLWGAPLYDTSVSFAFADMVVVGFYVMCTLRNPLNLSERAWLTGTAVFGSLLAYLEFLTGQIPLALALIPGLLAISVESTDECARARSRAFTGLASFMIALIATVVFKQLLVAMEFGQSGVSSFFSQLGRYTGAPVSNFVNPQQAAYLAHFGISAVSPGGLLSTPRLLFVQFFLNSGLLGFGMNLVGSAILLGSILVLIVKGTLLWRSRATLAIQRFELILVSFLMLVIWYVVMTSHAIEHASYMIRPLVWLPVSAIVVFIIGNGPTRPVSP